MLTVTRGNLTFDVHEHGSADGVPVLLLHGFPQRGTAWDGVASRLVTAGYRTLAPDQRGYSPCARPRGRSAYRLSEIVGDALAIVDVLVGPSGRVHVVGHDWGAAVGWSLAARHPDRVRSLTAVSVPPPPVYVQSLLTTRQAFASWYIYALQLPVLPERLLGARGRPFSPALVAALQRSGQSRAAAERDAAGLADPAALTAAINWYRALPTRPSGSQEPPVAVPTQFVWSDGDTAITRQATELTHQHVTGPFRYVELRGVSHWILEEAPDQLAQLVLDQLGEHPS
ncbi:alpha/beta fold hydrolase [Pseudonocardia xinjiangensis]|uniref:Alpha/beta fold hydrolase n=1 Tax=Pseudonocardia xinjiangensis TaxID=75289 RepID=A0ABX1RC21_9PSEU|nr:alpha/beta fold hydrolase [Pseudonocardia xinjiangensis]NMH76969.1 alpha/beta fold hydrolase [Pseudonocardia xinjiangensis]